MTPAPRPVTWVIHERRMVTSTMDVAAALAAAGAPEGTVVVAERQTAGRGRSGRTWQDVGVALQATIVLRPSLPARLLTVAPLLFGVAAAEAVETRCPATRIWLKWPNDLWVGERNDGRKLGGILVEMKANGAMLAGFGINIDLPAGAHPPGAACLATVGCPVAARDLLDALLARIAIHWQALIGGEGRVPLDGWRSRAALFGEWVAIIDHDGVPRSGRFIGIREDGALLLADDAGGIHPVVAGDLARGPRPT